MFEGRIANNPYRKNYIFLIHKSLFHNYFVSTFIRYICPLFFFKLNEMKKDKNVGLHQSDSQRNDFKFWTQNNLGQTRRFPELISVRIDTNWTTSC